MNCYRVKASYKTSIMIKAAKFHIEIIAHKKRQLHKILKDFLGLRRKDKLRFKVIKRQPWKVEPKVIEWLETK